MAKPFFPNVWFWLGLVILSCFGVCLLLISPVPGSSATVLKHHWQLPEKPELGQTTTFTLQVNAWKKPADNCLQIICDQEIDWQTMLAWQRQGFANHAPIWETTINFWPHAPGQSLSGQVTFLPTSEIFTLPSQTITLPEQPLYPAWIATSEAAIAPSQDCGYGFWFVIILMICGCGVGVGLAIRRQLKDTQVQQSLRRLFSAAASSSAEPIHQVMISFFDAQASFVPGHDLRRLALHWRWHQTSNAWLAPSLQHLAEHLERLRFQKPHGLTHTALDSSVTLAAFIIRNYRPE